MKKINHKNRKAFSLVELVVVILIIAVLAVAVFAGGSKTIRKSQVSRTVSDLHNFSIAAETVLNENPYVANISTASDYNAWDGAAASSKIVNALNNLLAEDYKLEPAATTTNITNSLSDSTTAFAYQSKKTDAWGNHYFVIFDLQDLHGTRNSDFYITVISAGPDAKTAIGGTLGANGADDIFMLAQYTDGDVASATYDMSSASNDTLTTVTTPTSSTQETYVTTKNLAKASANYSGASSRPVNF